MVLCKFWAHGNCTRGNSCKFEHPSPAQQQMSNTNRFASLQAQSPASRNSNQTSSPLRLGDYGLDKESIKQDLTSERPQWILSAYGPGRHAPAQLFSGMREQSFEEMRLLHYMAENKEQAINEALQLYNEAESQMQTALNDIDGAINYITSAANQHPNRLDICNGPEPNSAANPFGQASTFSRPATSSPFGQPSQQTTAFGQPAASTSNDVFGQASRLGQKPNPFAAPAPAPAFGAPSQLGAPGTFGQPSGLGQPLTTLGGANTGNSSTAAPFSSFQKAGQQASQQGQTPSPFNVIPPAQVTSFGQSSVQIPNPFIQAPSQNVDPFATAAAPSSTPFGAPSLLQNTNPFVQAQTQNASAFTTPPPALSRNPFGVANDTIQNPAPNPFSGAPAPIVPPNANLLTSLASKTGSEAIQANPFAPAMQSDHQIAFPHAASQASNNPFGSAAPLSGIQNVVTPAASGSIKPNNPLGDKNHPPLVSYASVDAAGRLTMFKGRPVVYKTNIPGVQGRNGAWEKIWFPQGPPSGAKDLEVDESRYDDRTKEAYEQFRATGSFQSGFMPMLPPKRTWCSFDF